MHDTPKCPIHKAPMAAATHWVKTSNGPCPIRIYCCNQTNCLYVHDAVQGFYEAPGRTPIGQSLRQARHFLWK
jgi:hypothetical protein